MGKEVRNLRRMLRLLPVRKGECIKFSEDYNILHGMPVWKTPRELIIKVPIEDGTDWQALCERAWKTNKKKKIWQK